ncbi:MAG: GNAT family N-acetyltransferase, partial [Stenotrophomonas sp.]
FYASEGFTLLPEPEWGAGLRGVMAEEAALGFPMHLRVAMRRVL